MSATTGPTTGPTSGQTSGPGTDLELVHGRAGRVFAFLRSLGVADRIALLVLAFLLVALVAPGVLAPGDPLAGDPSSVLLPPSTAHWLGTDYTGRDVWTRLVHGTARTFLGSAIAVVVGLGVGTVLGLVAAYFSGPVDTAVSRFVDVLLSIPGLLLAMVVVVSFGFGAFNAAFAVGIASIAVFTRLMRSEVLTVKGLPFVEASHHLGGSTWHVLRVHVFPNSYGAVLSLTALQFGLAILWISALSFLGYGAPPPEPEWGLLIAEGRDYVVSSPWLVYAPGVFIAGSVLALSRVGQLVKERWGS